MSSICVLMPLYVCAQERLLTTRPVQIDYICVLVPLYMCPHTSTCVSSGAAVDDTAKRLVCADVEEPRGIRYSSLRTHINQYADTYIVVCGHITRPSDVFARMLRNIVVLDLVV